MQPGDILYFCGLHKNGNGDGQIVTGAPGITISGDCPNNPGVLWSTGRRLTRWGAANADGVYSTTYGGAPTLASDANQTLLKRLGSPPTAKSPCNSWYFGDRFYYKPCGAPLAVHPNGRSPAVLVRHNDVTITNLTVFNAPRLVEVNNARRVTLRWLHLYRGPRHGIHLTGTTGGGRILDSVIHNVGNGIYGSTTGNGHHDNWVVARNRIRSVRGGPEGDSHCIGWQNGNNNRIVENILEDCAGPALAIYWWGETGQLRDNEWSYNIIRSPANTAISISGNNCPPVPTDAGGNIAVGNEIQGGPLAFYAKVPPGTLSVLDNKAANAEIGLKWKYISGGNKAGAPPPFIETGNIWDAETPYLPPPKSYACP